MGEQPLHAALAVQALDEMMVIVVWLASAPLAARASSSAP